MFRYLVFDVLLLLSVKLQLKKNAATCCSVAIYSFPSVKTIIVVGFHATISNCSYLNLIKTHGNQLGKS